MKRTLISTLVALIWVGSALAQTTVTTPDAPPTVSNVSLRSTVANGGSSIVGFVINGTANRTVLIRAVGPTLAMLGVIDALDRPVLSLYRGRQLLAVNSGWGTASSTGVGPTTSGVPTGGSTTPAAGSVAAVLPSDGTLPGGKSFTVRLATPDDFAQAGAFGLPAGSDDAAFLANLPPGAYTVVVSGNSSTTALSTGTSLGTSNAGNVTTTTVLAPGATSGVVAGPTDVASTGSTTDGIPITGLPATPVDTDSIGTTVATPSTSTTTVTPRTLGTGNATITVTPPPFASTPATATGGDVLVEVYFLD